MEFLSFLYENVAENFDPRMLVMWAIGGILIFLAIKKDMEPTLLLPIGFGAILVNLPLSGVVGGEGALSILYEAGIANELFPLLLFIGVGAMIDFGPILANPKLMIFGAAAQFGIFFTFCTASMFFDVNDAASIAIIGAADGPTSIVVAQALKSQYLGAYGGGVLLHGARTDCPAACHQTADHEERTDDPYALPRKGSLQADPHSLPDHHHGGGGVGFSAVCGAGRIPDVRQPDPLVRGVEFALRNGTEGACKPDHHCARHHDCKPDAVRSVPETRNAPDPGAGACGVRL